MPVVEKEAACVCCALPRRTRPPSASIRACVCVVLCVFARGCALKRTHRERNKHPHACARTHTVVVVPAVGQRHNEEDIVATLIVMAMSFAAASVNMPSSIARGLLATLAPISAADAKASATSKRKTRWISCLTSVYRRILVQTKPVNVTPRESPRLPSKLQPPVRTENYEFGRDIWIGSSVACICDSSIIRNDVNQIVIILCTCSY